MKRRSSTEASEKDQAKRVSDLFVCKGVPDHIRSYNGKPRDELLQRQAFDTLLDANGALSNGGSSTPARSDRTVPWAIPHYSCIGSVAGFFVCAAHGDWWGVLEVGVCAEVPPLQGLFSGDVGVWAARRVRRITGCAGG